MIRIAIMSDIHASSDVLQLVLKDARRNMKVDEYWMLGDAVGYGHDPVRVLKKLKSLNIKHNRWLAGNHDWGLLHLHDPSLGISLQNFNKYARRALELNYNAMKSSSEFTDYIEMLMALPYLCKPLPGIVLAHGAYYPDEADVEKAILRRYADNVSYIEEDYAANYDEWQSHRRTDQPFLVMYGHNHRPALWERQTDDEPDVDKAQSHWKILPLPFNEAHALKPGMMYHLNPGSAGGLSRDSKYRCASYLVMDYSETDIAIQFRQVSFNTKQIRNTMMRAGIPKEIPMQKILDCS